MNILPFIQYHQ